MRELSHKIDVTSEAREAPLINPPFASNKRFHPTLPEIAHRPIYGAFLKASLSRRHAPWRPVDDPP
jgi:hypothetical protein